MTSSSPDGPRVLILGDSWIRGLLLERRKAFGKLVAEGMSASAVLDLSAISRTSVDVVSSFLQQMEEFRPTVTIVNLGGADALIFPRLPIQKLVERFLPATGHGAEAWMPSASYSSNRRKRIKQRLTHICRVATKQVLINVLGGYRRVPAREVEETLSCLFNELQRQDSLIIAIGYAPVDGLYSPKTTKNLKKTNVVLKNASERLPGTIYIDPTGFLKRWEDYMADHVHLNAQGHARVAQGVLDVLEHAGEPWRDLVAHHV